tara:strand:+ start:1938 stop:2738 length:801 start_codon:yes stop_codon:yes gene_type:complete
MSVYLDSQSAIMPLKNTQYVAQQNTVGGSDNSDFYNSFYLPQLESVKKVYPPPDQANNRERPSSSTPQDVRSRQRNPVSKDEIYDYWYDKYVKHGRPFAVSGALNGTKYMIANDLKLSDEGSYLHGHIHDLYGSKPKQVKVKIVPAGYHGNHPNVYHNYYQSQAVDKTYAIQQAKELNAILFNNENSDSSVGSIAKPVESNFLNSNSSQKSFQNQQQKQQEPYLLQILNLSNRQSQSGMLYLDDGKLVTNQNKPVSEIFSIEELDE